jgi:hypothetical protein
MDAAANRRETRGRDREKTLPALPGRAMLFMGHVLARRSWMGEKK